VFIELVTMEKTPIPERLRQALQPFLAEPAALER
jgi:hypothetical protein